MLILFLLEFQIINNFPKNVGDIAPSLIIFSLCCIFLCMFPDFSHRSIQDILIFRNLKFCDMFDFSLILCWVSLFNMGTCTFNFLAFFIKILLKTFHFIFSAHCSGNGIGWIYVFLDSLFETHLFFCVCSTLLLWFCFLENFLQKFLLFIF